MPDAIEPITALRAWSVDAALNLHSPMSGTGWVPGEWMIAECPWRNHRAPHEGCTCGFYAIKDGGPASALIHLPWGWVLPPASATEVVDQANQRRGVLGRVHLAGKIIEHDDGYRAECARIVELLPLAELDPMTESVARHHGVRVGEQMPESAMRDAARIAHVHRSWGCPAMSRPSTANAATAAHSDLGEILSVIFISLLIISTLLFILSIPVFFVVNGIRGILWDHRLDWSDWWLCAIVVLGALPVLLPIALLLRSFAGHRIRAVRVHGPERPVPSRGVPP